MHNPIEDLVRQLKAAKPQPIPDDLSTVDKMMDKALEFAQHCLVDRGDDASMVPTWAVVTKNGQSVIFATPFDGGDLGKDMVAEGMRLFMEKADVVRYTFTSEAWAAQTTKDAWEQDDRPPSQRDDRVEVVMIIGAEKDVTTIDTYEMVRDWKTGSVVELKRQGERREETGFSGRFANLLVEDDG